LQAETLLAVPFPRRVRDTFLAPGRMARLLRPSNPWLDVALLSTGVAIVSVLAIPDDVFLTAMDGAVNRRGEPVEIVSSPEAIVRWGRALAMLGTLATHPIFIFALAGLLTLVFGIVGRGRGTFIDFLSLSSHAMLIPALGTVLNHVLQLGANAAGIDAMAPGAGLATGVLSSAAAGVDPFILWMLVVVAIGAHHLDARHGPLPSSLLLIAGYLVLVFARAALLQPETAGASAFHIAAPGPY
jgi:hypothetical protein